MKKTTIPIVMGLLCHSFWTCAQEVLPDVAIASIYNYKTPVAKLSDFKGKILILDFWATWCTSCLHYLPKIEALQNEFAGKVQFLMVTRQKHEVVLPFLEKFHKGRTSVIPVITDDFALNQLFPHRYLPHYVWIDTAGRLIATTAAQQITAQHINLVLADNYKELKFKVDVDGGNPLFLTNELLKNNQVLHYSLFFKGQYDGLPTGVSRLLDSAGRQTGLNLVNLSLAEMYQNLMYTLFEQLGDRYTPQRRILKVNNLPAINGNGSSASADLYTYSYNAPQLSGASLWNKMLTELNSYTDFIGTIEKMKVRCLVLRRSSSKDKIKTAEGKPENSLFSKEGGRLVNYPLAYLLLRMSDLPFINVPLVNETGYIANADISLSWKPDLKTLRQELKAYDLELVEAEREVNLFILKDKVALSINNQNPKN